MTVRARDEADRIVKTMVAEVNRLKEAKANISAPIVLFAFMDAMAWASIGEGNVKGSDFVAWVDQYMPVNEPREYHYSGADLYKARCSLLHQFAAHEKHPIKFAYVDGGPHRHRKDISPYIVILSVETLADDFWAAVARFLVDVRGTKRWPAIEARFAQMYEYTKRDESGTYR